MSSLAQDELGHAAGAVRAPRRADRDDGRDADALAYDREPDEYRHARLLDHGRGDWAMTIARRYLYDTADAVRLEALVGGVVRRRCAELVGKLRREERYHRDARRRLARAARRRARASRANGCWPRSTSWARTRRRCSRRSPARTGLVEAGHPRRADGRARGPLAGEHRADVRRPRPADAASRPRARATAGRDHGEPFRWLWSEFTMVRRDGPGGDVVSETGARRRGRAPRAAPTEAAVRAALAEVRDPELPVRLRRRPRDRPAASTSPAVGSRSSSCRRSSAARRSS